MTFKLILTSIQILLFTLITETSVGQETAISPERSKIEFKVTHLGVLTVDGSFTYFSGQMSNKKNLWMLNGTIQVNSISTGNLERDKVLLEPQYLYASQYPVIKFKGNGTTLDNKVNVTGNLTIKGTTKPISFTLLKEKDYFISNKIVIERKKFNLDFGGMDSLIGHEIEVHVRLAVN